MNTMTSAGQATAVSPAKLAHFVLRTSRYKEMVHFYKQVLAARPQFESDMLTFLAYDDEHHRVALLNIPGLQDQKPGVAGVHHIAFTYATLRDLVSNFERLKKAGIEPVWCTNHGPTTSMYYRDPDGNQLELQIDNFEDINDATNFFYTKEFAENPIGVDFDPADLARRLREGASESELRQRPHIGPRGFDASVKIY